MPEELSCQEASPFSNQFFIPCGKKAINRVDNCDRQTYNMCESYTSHNVTNRGAKIIGLARKDSG